MSNVKLKLLLLVIGAGCGLLLCEGLLALLGLPKFYDYHTFTPQFQFRFTKTGVPFYTNKPSSQITFEYDGNPRGYFDEHNRIVHTTNSMGFRGGKYSFKKRKGITRIAFLGDSFTFGEGVKDKDIFSFRVQETLNDLVSGKELFECYNFGVGGYNTAQSVFLFKEFVLPLSPDIVVLAYVLNDAEKEFFTYDQESGELKQTELYRAKTKPPETLLYKSRFAQALWKAFKGIEENRLGTQHLLSLYADDNPGWHKTKQALRDLCELTQERGIPLIVACLPIVYELNDRYPFVSIHELLAQTMHEVATPNTHYIDLFSSFKGKRYTALRVHPTDSHPNEVAHEIIAQSLSDAIMTILHEKIAATNSGKDSYVSGGTL